MLLFAVFLYVVEAKRDDFEDDVHKDFLPILFVFFLHKSKITKNDSKIIYRHRFPDGSPLERIVLRANER